jgi:tRNA (guanine-N7-)-methyltransferase
LLKNKGIIHLKTDNGELYNYTKKVVLNNGLEILFATNDLYRETLSDDILTIRTHYEKIFLDTGLRITYLSFRLDKDKIIV